MTDVVSERSDKMAEEQDHRGAAGRKRWQRPMVILSDVRRETASKGFGPEFFQPGFESS